MPAFVGRMRSFKNLLEPQFVAPCERTPGLVKISRVHQVKKGKRNPPIVFVPGALTGAWIWEDNFLPFFHKNGFDVHAMSFGGHGKSAIQQNQRTLDQFVAEAVEVFTQFECPPIVIAHSMGGIVSLLASKECDVVALALLSPVPTHGLAQSLISLGKKSPSSLIKMATVLFEPRASRLATPPLGIYSDEVPIEKRNEVTKQLQSESVLVLARLLFPSSLSRLDINAPVHFFGAEGDAIIPPEEVTKVANFFNAPVTIYAGLSHTFQSEPRWTEIAQDILDWLKQCCRDYKGYPLVVKTPKT